MPLWIGAYLADTMSLTTQQHGAYLLLLMAYWREEKPLPDDDDTLRSITKTDRAEWKKMRPVLEKFFKVDAGVWWQKRANAELLIAKSNSDANSRRGKAGAKARWEPPENDAQGMLEACSKHPSSIASSIPQAIDLVPKPMQNTMQKNGSTSHTNTLIGMHTDLNFKNSVCDPPHTQLVDNFRKVIETRRPELDAERVWAVFIGHYPPEKCTMARWEQWIENERAPGVEHGSGGAGGGVADPDSRASIEASGVALGLGVWNDLSEHWPAYKARVLAARGSK